MDKALISIGLHVDASVDVASQPASQRVQQVRRASESLLQNYFQAAEQVLLTLVHRHAACMSAHASARCAPIADTDEDVTRHFLVHNAAVVSVADLHDAGVHKGTVGFFFYFN